MNITALLLATLAVASFAKNALNFDGVDDYVQTSIPPDQIGSSFTVEAWINASGLVDGAIVSNLSTVKSSYYTISGFELHVGTDGALAFTVRSSNDSWIDFKTPSGLILTYDWIHVAATFDGTVVTMYINGEPQTVTGVMAGNFVPGTAPLKIGRRVTADEQTYSFYGNISEVQLWNTVRTPSEILLDMKGYDSKQTNQAAYYKLDQGTAEGSNTQVYDAICLVNADNNGRLESFALTGQISNWVSGYNPDQFGVAPSGTGSNADPYQIDSLPNLRWLSSNKRAWSAGVESKLMKNIDATDTKNWDDGKGFSPIGNGTKGFEGVFHGNGKVITGLTINRPSSDGLGFFGSIWSNAKIDSLGLVNASVIGRTSIGSFFGDNHGNISNCFVKTSSVTSTDSVELRIGLFGGENWRSISSSFATGSTVAKALKENVLSVASGFVAVNRSLILNSYSMGSVKSTSINANADAGGLVGLNFGSIRHCFSADTLLATSTSNFAVGGGIVATNLMNGLVSNSYSTGPIHTSGKPNAIGGIAGSNQDAYIDSSYSSAKFSVNSSEDYLGGVVGYFNGGSTNGCFWDVQTTGTTKAIGTGATTTSIGLSTEAMMSADSVNGLDLNNIWKLYEGHSYPLLRDFLTTLQVTAKAKVSKDYNKKPTAFADLVTYNLPSVDQSLLLGSLGKADTAKNVGTYSIDPSNLYSSQLGYLITPVGAGSLTINPKKISVTAIADTITVGASEPALEYKADALIAGDAFTGKLTRKSGTSAGKYPIQIGTLSAGDNYTIDFTSADFVIKAKPVFINPEIPQLPFTGQVNARIFNLQGVQVWAGLLDVTDGSVSMPNLGAGHWTVKMRMGNFEKEISTTLR